MDGRFKALKWQTVFSNFVIIFINFDDSFNPISNDIFSDAYVPGGGVSVGPPLKNGLLFKKCANFGTEI